MTTTLSARLESCYFIPPGRLEANWIRFAAVLRLTAAEHAPTWTVNVRELAPPRGLGRSMDSYLANTLKLDEWTRLVDEAADGERLALLDTDIFATGPLGDIWDSPFDVAYTARLAPECKAPLNAGVIFVRVSARSRAFMRRWRDENRRMLKDEAYRQPWRRKYAGLNQAALGKLLEDLITGSDAAVTTGFQVVDGPEEVVGLELLAIPCRQWNCEDCNWTKFDPALTRLVHVKSALRLAILLEGKAPAGTEEIVRLWRKADRAAGGGRGKVEGREMVSVSLKLPAWLYDELCTQATRDNGGNVSGLMRDRLIESAAKG